MIFPDTFCKSLIDIVVANMLADAKAAGQKDRLGSIPDLDAAATVLRQACAVLLDDGTPDRAMRKTVFDRISRAELAEDIAQIDNRARPVFSRSCATSIWP
jgi:hypothetical protein